MCKIFASRVGRAAALAAVWLGSALIVVPGAWAVGPRGAATSALGAWALCVASGVLARWLACRSGDPRQLLVGVLATIAARTGIPLGICLAVYYRPGVWAEAGFVYYLLIFYFLTLAVETSLLVASVTAAEPQAADAPTRHDGLDHG